MKNQITDLTFLRQFTREDKSKMGKYIQMFLVNAPIQVKAMQEYLREEKWDELRIAAHSLKPQLEYMGIKNLKEIAQQIEENTKGSQQLENIPFLVTELSVGCESAIAELQEYLES
jgi:HPt (histidine-containing phosphotransfer) domain-containing protein